MRFFSNPVVTRAGYALAIVLSYGLTAFAIQLGAGKVPIPEAWQWTVPIIGALITASLMLLPRPGAVNLAQQVDQLAAQGIQKRDMVVMPRRQAERMMATHSALNREPGDVTI